MLAASSIAALAPPKVPSTGASGRWAGAPLELPDMSIPAMPAGMLAVGVGVLPDMSIPAMPAGMLAVGVGVLPDMSIPAMSAGISAVLGTGLSDPARTETAAALTTVAADDCWFEVSINDPMTAMAPTVALTEATRIRRHQGASPVIRLW
jgi:hypothetical protein